MASNLMASQVREHQRLLPSILFLIVAAGVLDVRVSYFLRLKVTRSVKKKQTKTSE